MNSLLTDRSRAFLLAFLVAALSSRAEARTTSGSTTDANGNTFTVTKNPDGTTTRTTTSPEGQVIDQSTTAPEPPTKVAPRQPGTSASMTDADGNTITIKKNPDGGTTRTITSPDGQVLSSEPLTPEPPTHAPPRQPHTSGSTTNPDGTTTTITKNPDGTTTQTITRPDGQVLSSGPIQPEPPTKAAPRQPGTSGSVTNPDGTTTTITKNPDGTTTRTLTGPDGHVISSGPIQPEPPTKVPPRQPGTSASTRNADGTTTTITKNPDGTSTRTVTGQNGQVIWSEPVEPPPITKTPPRTPGTSASMTDADGNTITIKKNPDGTTTRTITDPSGRVISSGPIIPQPPTGAQLLYNAVANGDCTLNSAMVLRTEQAKTLLDVSLLATGKGTNFRTWVPEQVNLILGKEKLKPVAATPYYVQKESAAAGFAPILFAAIGAKYAADAKKAESSKGTPCPLTGKTEEEPRRERGTLGRAIDEAGTVAGLSLLASQAKGEIEGRRVTFDVSGREDQLAAGTVLARVSNTDTNRINLANEPKDIQIKVPVTFKAK